MVELKPVASKLEDLRKGLENLQKQVPADSRLQEQIQRLQTEFFAQRARPERSLRRRSRMAIVQPTPPPITLTDVELALWQTFSDFHAQLLAYSGSGGINWQGWTKFADIAADMTAGVYSGGSMAGAPSTGLAYGLQNGVWVPVVPLMGVTNGADALPGQVGECIETVSATFTPIAITAPNSVTQKWISLVQTVVTAGDWDVTANVATGMTSPVPSGSTASFIAQMSTQVGTPNIGYGVWAGLTPAYPAIELALSTHRIIVAASTTIFVMASIQTNNATDNNFTGLSGAAMIHARRCR